MWISVLYTPETRPFGFVKKKRLRKGGQSLFAEPRCDDEPNRDERDSTGDKEHDLHRELPF